MGIAQIAVMPLQALVDFFAPEPHASRMQGRGDQAHLSGSVYWARERLAQRSPAVNPVRPASRPVWRISRTGLVVGAGAPQATRRDGPADSRAPVPANTSFLGTVRMRRSLDLPRDMAQRLAGRMVIAGRMRDVCAVLNGMAD